MNGPKEPTTAWDKVCLGSGVASTLLFLPVMCHPPSWLMSSLGKGFTTVELLEDPAFKAGGATSEKALSYMQCCPDALSLKYKAAYLGVLSFWVPAATYYT